MWQYPSIWILRESFEPSQVHSRQAERLHTYLIRKFQTSRTIQHLHHHNPPHAMRRAYTESV